jgi:hypothetical protein
MRDGKPTAQFNGGFQVAKLDLVEEGTKERFLGWDMVDARGSDFKFEPTRLDILEIRLDRPGGKFIIYEDRTLNVSASRQKEEQESTEDRSLRSKEEGQPPRGGWRR